MRWLIEIVVFLAGITAGLVLGGLVPVKFVPKSSRIPVAAFLIGVGIALAVIGFS